MELIKVDSEKCRKDGVCGRECPTQIIGMGKDDGLPTFIEGGEKYCIACGHCMAVCPHGALSFNGRDPSAAIPVSPGWALDPVTVSNLMMGRRSIRCFQKKPVDKAVIEQLLNICRFAPSGHNNQPVHWNILLEKEGVREVSCNVSDWMKHMIREMPEVAREYNMEKIVAGFESGYDGICRDAPHLVAVHAPKQDRSAPAACTIALTYLDLAAPSFQLGTCWAGYVQAAAGFWPPLQKVLGIPEGHICLGAMMIGHPKFDYQRIPGRKPARVTWM